MVQTTTQKQWYVAAQAVLMSATNRKSSSQVRDCKLKTFAKVHSAESINNFLFLKKQVSYPPISSSPLHPDIEKAWKKQPWLPTLPYINQFPFNLSVATQKNSKNPVNWHFVFQVSYSSYTLFSWICNENTLIITSNFQPHSCLSPLVQRAGYHQLLGNQLIPQATGQGFQHTSPLTRLLIHLYLFFFLFSKGFIPYTYWEKSSNMKHFFSSPWTF